MQCRQKRRLSFFTIGEHGIEGFVGSAILDLFFREISQRLDPKSTGLFLIHSINPWGMKNFRRTNQNNVDVNRNFTLDPANLDPSSNPDYQAINAFINPATSPTSLAGMRLHFISGWSKVFYQLAQKKYKSGFTGSVPLSHGYLLRRPRDPARSQPYHAAFPRMC